MNFDPLTLTIFVASLSLVPFFLIVTTAFLKIAIVLMITRNAMGIQQIPPNMALYGIALAATFFVMAPVINSTQSIINDNSITLRNVESISTNSAELSRPLRQFMIKNTAEGVPDRLIGITRSIWPVDMAEKANKDNLMIVVPAFVLSELQAGFKIGFLIYIPFIVIDLIISNILLALGMQMVAPMTISLPLKVLLFILVDGWTRLLESLFYSYIH